MLQHAGFERGAFDNERSAGISEHVINLVYVCGKSDGWDNVDSDWSDP